MRLRELFEATPSKTLEPGEEKLVDVVDWQWLTEHTRQYRQYVNKANKWLYRGIKSRPPAFHGRSRDDRMPESSHTGPSMVFDYILAHHFNATALRLNSTFCTSDVKHTKVFGRPYVLFPLDGFRFTYTNQHDMVLSGFDRVAGWQQWKFDNWIERVLQQAGNHVDADWLENNIQSRESYPYDLIEQWLPQHAEALMGMGIDRRLAQISLDDFVDLEEFKKYFAPKTTDLDGALSTGVEVYIRGEYVALDLDTYAEKIQDYFRIEVA
jgi:hypothetical protein